MLYIMYFIYNSAPLKEEYEKDGAKGENLNSSIFPENRIDGGTINNNLGLDPSEVSDEEVDGDALIRNRRNSSASSAGTKSSN